MIPHLRVSMMPGAGPFDVAGDYYLLINGAANSNASTPHHTSLGITGDMEIQFDATLESWAAPSGTGMELIGKFQPPSNQSWLLWVTSQRQLVFRHSTDGTAIIDNVCPVKLPVASGRLALRVRFDADNGAAGHSVFFYTASTISGPWSLLSAVSTAGATSIHNSTASLGVGDVPSSGFRRPIGRIHAAKVYAGLASTDLRADPDFASQPPGTTSFADSTGRTWTVGAAAEITGFDWVDITNYDGVPRLLAVPSMEEGRQDDLTQFGPGRQQLILENRDRLFDPTHTAGDFYGKLNPRTPFRFELSPDGVAWTDWFCGFARGGFRQTYAEGGTWATCTVDLEDLLAAISNTRLPDSAYSAAVIADHPGAYWTQDETSGTQMADSSGNGRHGRFDNGTLGEEPLIIGEGHSFYAPHVGDNRGEFKGEGLPTEPPCTLEAWIKTPRDAAAVKTIIAAQRDQSLGSALWFQIATALSGSPNGELVIDWFGLGTFYKVRGHTRVDDDRPHHVVCTIASTSATDVKLYVDGVEQVKTVVTAGSPGNWAAHLIWTVGNTTDTGQGDYGLDGWIDEAAIYDYALSAEQVLEHYQSGVTAHSGDKVGERIDRVLDIVGVPPALRDIDPGDTTLGPAFYGGDRAGPYLDRLVESEQGYLWVNHRNGGKVTFRGRYSRLTDTRSTTSQATFTDDETPGVGEYRFKTVEPVPNGIDSVVNEIDVHWQGGVEPVADDASIAAYGAQSRTLVTEAPTPKSARSAAGWMVTRYGRPRSRVRALRVSPGTDPDVWPAVLDLRVGDRVTVTYTPQGVGSPITESLIVEGIRNDFRGGVEWDMSYTLSDADNTLVWIWGTSTWGETTVWG